MQYLHLTCGICRGSERRGIGIRHCMQPGSGHGKSMLRTLFLAAILAPAVPRSPLQDGPSQPTQPEIRGTVTQVGTHTIHVSFAAGGSTAIGPHSKQSALHRSVLRQWPLFGRFPCM